MAQTEKKKKSSSLRTLFLQWIPILAVLLIDVFFLAMLENLFFNKKRALFIDSQTGLPELLKVVTPLQDRLTQLKSNYAHKESLYLQEAKKYLEKEAPAVLAGDHPWCRIELKNANKQIVAEYSRLDKLRKYNTWKNCLFTRSFQAPVASFNIQLTVYYATPKDWHEIERLVSAYRIYAALFVVGTWLIYGWLYRNMFSPLQRIGAAIEHMIQSELVSLIVPPRHEIERTFNRLVRNQREVYFSLEVDRLVESLHALSDDEEVLQQFFLQIVAPIQKVYPMEFLASYRKTENASEFRMVGKIGASEVLPTNISSEAPNLSLINDSDWGVYLEMGNQPIGALLCHINVERMPDKKEWEYIAGELKKQIENGLARALTRSHVLTEERNRFGINLATNMGHDLTNIIASGKWDLDTIQRAQSLGIVTMEPKRGQFFLEAVKGLRHNLHFLQEMVDIYRSFGYTRSPRFELTNVSTLIRETTELFRRSTSQKISLQIDVDGQIETAVEPRLLRMALFNLLVNASQAIQRNPMRVREGKISVSLKSNANQTMILKIYDNGPGIRNKEGVLLEIHEINRIFQAGYTTKAGNQGSGLGLSWVKSIVEDYHQGSIRASNNPEGGACFTITLPYPAPSSE